MPQRRRFVCIQPRCQIPSPGRTQNSRSYPHEEVGSRGSFAHSPRRRAEESNLLRRNGVTGESLLKTLANLFHHHNMRAWMDRQGSSSSHPIPKIICSEALGLS